MVEGADAATSCMEAARGTVIGHEDTRKEESDRRDPNEGAFWENRKRFLRRLKERSGSQERLRQFLEFFGRLQHCWSGQDESEKKRRILELDGYKEWVLNPAELDLKAVSEKKSADEILTDLWYFDLRTVQMVAQIIELPSVISWLSSNQPVVDLQTEISFAFQSGNGSVRQGLARLVIALHLRKPRHCTLSLPTLTPPK